MANNKASTRAILKKLHPSAFFETSRAPSRQIPATDVVIEDALIILRSVTSAMKPRPDSGFVGVRCGADLVKLIKRSAEETLLKSQCKMFVACYDKQAYVSLGKADTQAKRDDSARQAEADKTADVVKAMVMPPKPYLSLDKPLPDNWNELLSDRAGFRQWAISWVWEQLIASPDHECRLTVPHEKAVVVDGHCFTRKVVERVNERLRGTYLNEDDEVEDFLELPEEKDPYDVPITITGGMFGEKVKAWFEVTFENRVGEADFGMFYLWKRIRELNDGPDEESYKFQSVRIDSTDTDVMGYCLIFKDAFGDESSGRMFWKFTRRGKEPKEWVDVDALHRRISAGTPWMPFDFLPPETKKRPFVHPATEARKASDFRHAFADAKYGYAWQILAASWFAKCDYTVVRHGITHYHCLEAIHRHAAYIGPLIRSTQDVLGEDWGPTVDGEAVARLFKCAYVRTTKRLATEKKEKKKRKRGVDDDDDEDEEPLPVDPETITYKKIRERTWPSRKNPKKTLSDEHAMSDKTRWPSTATLVAKASHLALTARLVSQLGQKESKDPEDILRFGFKLIDERGGTNRENIAHRTE